MNKVQFPIETGSTRPCREIENIDYQSLDSEALTHDRHVAKLQGKDWTEWFCVVWRYLNTRFVTTISKKEVDFQSVIGYIGGFIGRFTGLALAQIPEILLSTFDFAKQLIKPKISQTSNDIPPTSLPSQKETIPH